MKINLEVDLDQPSDVAQLTNLASAFSGAPGKTTGKDTSKTGNSAGNSSGGAAANSGGSAGSAAGATRVTVEMVREAASTKKAADCKAAFKEMGFEGLSTIPADRLADALEKVKALANK